MRTIVHGATGTQGRPTIDVFAEAGLRPIAATRRPAYEHVHDLEQRGVEVRTADLDDRESLERAYADADAVVLHLPLVFDPEVMWRRGKNAIDAAERVGVRRFVYNVGVCVPLHHTLVPLFAVMQNLAAHVLQRLSDPVVLRPPLYLENLLAPWTRSGIGERGEIAYPLPADRPLPWIGLPNVGRLALGAVRGTPPPRATLGARDPELATGRQIAELVSARLGRPVRWKSVSPAEFATRVGAALGEGATEAIEGFYTALTAEDCALLRSVEGEAASRLDTELEPTPSWVARAFGA